MEDQLKQLTEIRSLMERSSRFISLSGLSGIAAGCVALIGAAAAYWYLDLYLPGLQSGEPTLNFAILAKPIAFLFTVAFSVMFLAIVFGIVFTLRNSRKKQLNFWDRTTRRLLINLFIPLAAGGFFALIMISRGQFVYISGLTLVFYGLALLNAGNYTYSDIRVLGVLEICLGLLAIWFVGYGLLFWALGFGVLHIIYGAVMYRKYERNTQ